MKKLFVNLLGVFLTLSFTLNTNAQVNGTWDAYMVADSSYDNLPKEQEVVAYDPTRNAIATYEYLLFLDNDSSYKYNDGAVVGSPDYLSVDKNGHIWMSGAWIGANRYDGLFFTHYKNWDTQNGGIIQVEPDMDGNIWYGVVFGTGTFKFDGTNNTQEHAFDSDLIRQGANGNMWFGSTGSNGTDGQLYRYDGTNWNNIAVPNLLGQAFKLNDLVEESDGTLWVAVQALDYSSRDLGGLFKRTPSGTWTSLTTADGLPASGVLSLALDHDGNLWAGTTKGLAYLKNGSVENSWTPDAWGINTTTFENGDVSDIAIDAQNRIWIANRGIFRLTLDTPLSTDKETDELAISMYPNPVHQERAFVNGIPDGTHFQILSLNGNEMMKGNYTDAGINTSSLSRGIYLLKIDYVTVTFMVE